MKMNYFVIGWLLFLFIKTYSAPGDIIKAWKAPGENCTGLAWDGKNLWVVDQKSRTLFKLNQDGQVIKKFSAPSYWPVGLTFDGKTLWLVDERGGIPKIDDFYQGYIYQIDTATGNIIKSQELPFVQPVGIAFDGTYFWTIDDKEKKLISFSGEDGTAFKEYVYPAPGCLGIAYGNKYLWIGNHLRNEIYMVDPSNGKVLKILPTPGEYIRDLAYFNNALWVLDSQTDSVYLLQIDDGTKWVRTNPRKVQLSFIEELYNFGPGNATNVSFNIAVPENDVHQEVASGVSFYPADYKILKDEWGQQVAQYTVQTIPPGKSASFEMNLTATLYDVRYYIDPELVKKAGDIPADIKKIFLADDEKFKIKDPVIQNAVKEAVGNETNPYWKALKIYYYIIDKMTYERSGGWNPAPTVLSRGTGSCSEYSFVFIAMSRAAGIPARFAGSVAKRSEESAMDDIFHRWVEIYLPGYGWVPLDPSGGDNPWPADQARYFGFVSNRFLVTTHTGGKSKYLQFNYNGFINYSHESPALIYEQMYGDWDVVK